MFYWDDEVLGDKPDVGRPGSFKGRRTILKEGVVDGWVVLYLDNNEICLVQTMAYAAAERGFSNIGDFLLELLESPEVQNFLQTEEARGILKSEFDYLRESLRQLNEDNERLRDVANVLDDDAEERRFQLRNLLAALEFAEMQVEEYRQAFNKILDRMESDKPDEPLVARINERGEFDDFGDWIYLAPPNKGGWIN